MAVDLRSGAEPQAVMMISALTASFCAHEASKAPLHAPVEATQR
jgi:hypothetical protein